MGLIFIYICFDNSAIHGGAVLKEKSSVALESSYDLNNEKTRHTHNTLPSTGAELTWLNPDIDRPSLCFRRVS